MKIYKSFEEIKDADPFIQEYFAKLEGSLFNDLLEEIPTQEDFESYYGGYAFVIETDEDLKDVSTTIEDPERNRWKSIDEVSDDFDECRIHSYSGKEYLIVYNTTNNSGGNTYFIPVEYIEKYPIIEKSIKYT